MATKLYAQEIDGFSTDNLNYLELWQKKFCNIRNKLIRKGQCVNCKKTLTGNVHYVACYSGKLVAWHNKCNA